MSVHRVPGMVLSDHRFEVPLRHDRPDDGETIEVFAREVVSPKREGDDLPWLVFLQGGPGFGAPRPLTKGGWLERALEEYRVVLLDQRGTGASTPQTRQTLAHLGPEAQAERLACFRADAIVRDAEHVRRRLAGDRPWTVLGQSYGGFCAVHYLSVAAEGLEGCIITGGLPPLERPVDDVYRATYRRVADRNRRYHERYPGDAEHLQDMARELRDNAIALPGGGRLTVPMLQQLGMAFGMSDGFETVHYLIEDAFVMAGADRQLAYAFLRAVEAAVPFQLNPIYAILHEPIYCQGTASRWSAHRIRGEFPEFDGSPDAPLHFTGEMVFPWMFDAYPELVPLRDAAHILADKDDWSPLYDSDKLGANTTPVAAAIYHGDMYVERAFSEETAATIAGCRTWITDEYDHNALRADGKKLLGRLLDLLRGEA